MLCYFGSKRIIVPLTTERVRSSLYRLLGTERTLTGAG
jgi:hypothetical protein